MAAAIPNLPQKAKNKPIRTVETGMITDWKNIQQAEIKAVNLSLHTATNLSTASKID